MSETTESIAAPRQIDVPVQGGAAKLSVAPWTIAQHDECFPIVVRLIEGWVESQGSGAPTLNLGVMLTTYKFEVEELCKLTLHEELNRRDLKWGDLWAEDLFSIAQAIWETSLLRPDGGGVLGKALGLIGPSVLKLLAERKLATSAPSPQSAEGSTPPQTASASAA
ncbi:MAG: hypothetical protein WBG86_06260 [Polyangiales bacterium]